MKNPVAVAKKAFSDLEKTLWKIFETRKSLCFHYSYVHIWKQNKDNKQENCEYITAAYVAHLEDEKQQQMSYFTV